MGLTTFVRLHYIVTCRTAFPAHGALLWETVRRSWRLLSWSGQELGEEARLGAPKWLHVLLSWACLDPVGYWRNRGESGSWKKHWAWYECVRFLFVNGLITKPFVEFRVNFGVKIRCEHAHSRARGVATFPRKISKLSNLEKGVKRHRIQADSIYKQLTKVIVRSGIKWRFRGQQVNVSPQAKFVFGCQYIFN